MTQPNDEYHLSQSPPRNTYQLNNTERINYLESSVASFNHMVVLLNERLDALEATRHEAEIPTNVATNLGSRIERVFTQMNATYTDQKDHDEKVAAEIASILKTMQDLKYKVAQCATPNHDPSPEATHAITGPLPSRTYMDQIKKSLKVIETECDILKHLWRQP